jgi:hypothetical protein
MNTITCEQCPPTVYEYSGLVYILPHVHILLNGVAEKNGRACKFGKDYFKVWVLQKKLAGAPAESMYI